MKYKLFAMAAGAVMAGLLGFGSAQAANVMTGSGAPAGITKTDDGNIQKASHRRYWRRRSGLFLGLGFAPFLGGGYGYGYPGYGYGYGGYGYGGGYGYNDYYYAPRRYYRPARVSRHVRYCLNRYRTYNVRTNTFVGYDGDLHRCRSPYRY